MIIGYSDGTIGIFKVANLEFITSLSTAGISEEKLPIGAIRWRQKLGVTKERLLVSAGVDGNINYWSPLSGKLISSIKPLKKSSDLLCLDYSRDSSKLAAAGRRKSINIYDDEKRMLITKLKSKGMKEPGHSNRIFSVKFDETGKILLSGSWDMSVKVWDLTSGTVINTIYGPEINGDSVDVNSSSDLILTGSHRDKEALQIWSLTSGKLIENIVWDPLNSSANESSMIFGAQLEKTNLNFILACGSGMNEARIFDKVADKKYCFSTGVTNIPSACSSIDYASKDNLIAIGCCDGICRLFERIDKKKKAAAELTSS